MNEEFTLMPRQASNHAATIDTVYLLLVIISVAMTLAIAFAILFLASKYHRSRHGRARYSPLIKGSLRLEVTWIVIPTIVFAIIFLAGALSFVDGYQPPDDAMDIYVIGKQWMWKTQHPDGQREINRLTVPLNQPVRLVMTSEDVVHSFFMPAFRIKRDVYPGVYTSLWFEPTEVGTYHLFCAEYCGAQHSGMIGTVEVMEPDDYQRWLDYNADGSLATQGRQLFLKLKCIACHNATGQAHAPSLENLYGQNVRLQDGSAVRADETYIRESILFPNAKLVAGYQPIMPTYQGQVDEEDLLRLIAFIRSLRTGDTPRRVDDTPPPFSTPDTSPPNAPQAEDEQS